MSKEHGVASWTPIIALVACALLGGGARALSQVTEAARPSVDGRFRDAPSESLEANSAPTPNGARMAPTADIPAAGADSVTGADERAGSTGTSTQGLSSVSETQPSLLYIPDGKGELRALLGWKYDELMALLERTREGRVVPPGAVIRECTISGHVESDQALLSVAIEIKAREGGWSRIPLRFEPGILKNPSTGFRHTGDGEFVLHVDADMGYVLDLKGPAGSSHTFNFDVMAPVTKSAAGSKLVVSLPDAMATVISLQVPGLDLAASSSTGRVTWVPDASRHVTTIHVDGAMGRSFMLSWRDRPSQLASQAPVLDADLEGKIELDAAGATCDYVLRVADLRGALSEFEIEIPGDCTITEISSDNSRGAIRIPGESGANAVEGVHRYIVPFAKPGAQSDRISIRTTIPLGNSPTGSINISVPRVVGAARQRGVLAIAAEKDLKIDVGESVGWEQIWIGQLPSHLREFDEGSLLRGAFRFHQSPPSLPVAVAQRHGRITATPTYTLSAAPGYAEVAIRLTLEVTEQAVFEIKFAPQGWSLQSLEPADTFLVEGIRDDEDRLTFPLATPRDGVFEASVRFRRPLSAPESADTWRLPFPEVERLNSGPLNVIPSQEIRLTVHPEKSNGISVESDDNAPPLDQPLHYVVAHSEEAQIAVQWSRQSRPFSWKSQAVIQLNTRGCEIEQTFFGQGVGEALESVAFRLPATNLDYLDWRAELLDAEGLVTVRLPPEAMTLDLDQHLLNLRLPQPFLEGPVVRIAWTSHLPTNGNSRPALETPDGLIPLLSPVDGDYRDAAVAIRTSPTVSWNLPVGLEGWREEVAADIGSENTRRLVSTAPIHPLFLAVTRRSVEPKSQISSVDVSLESWIGPGLRQDRLVMTGRGAASEGARMRLPDGANLIEALAGVDRESLVPLNLADLWDSDRREINLPNHFREPLDGWTFVLVYRSPQELAHGKSMRLTPPDILGDLVVKQVVWRVELPPGERLLRAAEEYAQFASRSGWFEWLAPQDAMPNVDLARGSPVHDGQSLTRSESATLTFMRLGDLTPLELRLVHYTTILLAGAAVVLLAGLSILYLPARWGPATIFTAGVVLLATAALYPHLTRLLIEAIVVGAVLSFAAAWIGGRPARVGRGSMPPSRRWTGASAESRSSSMSPRELALNLELDIAGNASGTGSSWRSP